MQHLRQLLVTWASTNMVWIHHHYAFCMIWQKGFTLDALPAPISSFIWAWDQHQETLESAPDGWVVLFSHYTNEISFVIFKTIFKFSVGWDNIVLIVLKYLPSNSLSVISYIFKLSLSQEKFFSYFKHARVIPFFL